MELNEIIIKGQIENSKSPEKIKKNETKIISTGLTSRALVRHNVILKHSGFS